MLEFVQVILSLPTVIFTVPLVLVVGYWSLVILGALDLHVVDAAGSAGDALDVVGDPSGMDFHFHGFEGGLVSDFFHLLGLGGVPLTLWISLVTLFSWVSCLLTLQIFENVIPALPLAWLAGLGGLGIALVVTALVVRPVKRLFVSHTATERKALVGKVCTVTTMRVDDNFGQALIEDGGAGLLVQVRCDESNALTKGSHALIFDYNPDEEVFHVARFDEARIDTRSGK